MKLQQNVISKAKYDDFENDFWNTLPRDENGNLDENWIKQEMWDYFCTMYNYSYFSSYITDGEVSDTRYDVERLVNIVKNNMSNRVADMAQNYLYSMINEIDGIYSSN